MESGDVIIIDKPKRKSPTPKKKEGEERNVIIYKLEIASTNFLYVGHTENFKQRVDNHRTACRANLDPRALNSAKNSPLYVEINRNGGWPKVVMTPVEEFVSKNKVQSRIREQYWIDKIQVARRDAVMMNGCPAYVSPEQKVEHQAKYNEEHREENKARILATNLKKMTCPCGSELSKGGKSDHLKSKKHIAWERAKDQEFNDRLEKEMNELIENIVV
jgi:hypothetical protein